MAFRNFKVLPKCVSSSDTYPLTPEQVQFYRDNGYLVIKGLISKPALDSYRQRFKDVCNGRVKKGVVTVVKDRALSKTKTNPEDYINKDQYYFPFGPAHKIVGTWTAIDPVDMNNGCLYVIPGSHKPNILYDHTDEINDAWRFKCKQVKGIRSNL